MMKKVEERRLPCASPSVVIFTSQIDENELRSKSVWDPDWTIQREVSITIDKSVNDSSKLLSKKSQIFIAAAICIAIIISVLVPVLISIGPQWPPSTKQTILTTIQTTQLPSNVSIRSLEMYSCGNLMYLENVNLIGYDLMSKSPMTWSTCCSWCLSVSSCRAFTYETNSSNCSLKTNANDNEIYDKGYQSAKYT